MDTRTNPNGFAGLRVLSLESRRATEMAKLIETYGGVAVVAPSMREVPLETNTEAQAFTRKLLNNEFDAAIFLTGVGTRPLSFCRVRLPPRRLHRLPEENSHHSPRP